MSFAQLEAILWVVLGFCRCLARSDDLPEISPPMCATIMYMTTLPVADARAQLSRLVDEAERTHERFEITRNGHRAAVLLGADDYDALRETIAVLADESLLAAHLVGAAEAQAGDTLDVTELAAFLGKSEE